MADDATSYPGSVDTFTTAVPGVRRAVHPSESDRFNKLQTAAVAMQTAINTASSSATAARARSTHTGIDVIIAPSPGVIPIVVKGAAAQTSSLQEWQDSTGTYKALITAGGALVAQNIYNIGAIVTTNVQDAAQVGPYLQFGTGNIAVLNRTSIANVPLAVQGMAGQTGALTRWLDSTGAEVARMTADGSLVQINSYSASLASANLQDQSYTGPFISLGTAAVTVINRANVANIPLKVIGMAGQTADLQAWQNSSFTALARIDSAGSFRLSAGGSGVLAPYFQSQDETGPYLDLHADTGVIVINRTSTANIPLVVKGMASQSGDLQQWQDTNAAVVLKVGAGGTVTGSSSNFVLDGTNTFFQGVRVGGFYGAISTDKLVDFTSTVSGVCFPRMTTTQKNAIGTPTEGLVVYDLSLHKLCVRTASAWETITSA